MILQMRTPGLYFLLVGYRPGIFRDACVCEECAQYFPVSRLLGCSDFGDYLSCVEDAAIDNMQEKVSLGGGLMWNDAAV